jgi:hypothetical protein
VTVKSDPAIPNAGFIAANLNPGNYSITATWTGQPIPTTSRTLMAKWNGPISNVNNPLTLQFQ